MNLDIDIDGIVEKVSVDATAHLSDEPMGKAVASQIKFSAKVTAKILKEYHEELCHKLQQNAPPSS